MNPSPRFAYRPEIDGLRALAVLAVIINHFDIALLPGGYLGVDVFFVISGYVITAAIFSRRMDTLADFLGDFFRRRVKRLLPALCFCVLITGVLISMFDPYPQVSLHTGVAALIGMSNMFLLYKSADYFAPSTQANAYTQTWSLGVEEQFYLVYPFLVWLVFVSHGRRLDRVAFLRLMAVLSALSFAGYLALQHWYPSAAYYLMPSRFWQLGLGCLCFLVFGATGRPLGRGHGWSWAALLVLFAAYAMPGEHAVMGAALASIGATLLIASCREGGAVYRLLTLPVIRYIGLISYSLYLWHWTVLTVARWSGKLYLAMAPVLLLSLFAVAMVSYHLVEKPLRHASWSRRHWPHLAYGFLGALVVTTSQLVLANNHHKLFVEIESTVKVPPLFMPMADGMAFYPNCLVMGEDKPYNQEKWGHCTFPPAEPGGQMVWALGDSHMGHHQALLYGLRDQLGLGIHLIETPGVPFPQADMKSEARSRITEQVLKEAKPADIVISGRMFLDRDKRVLLPNVQQWLDEVPALAEQLRARGLPLVILGPLPLFRFENADMCRRGIAVAGSCDISRAELEPLIRSVHERLAEIERRHPNVHVFDQYDLFCPPGQARCSAIQDYTLLYRDRDHLNSGGSMFFYKPFVDFLVKHRLLRQREIGDLAAGVKTSVEPPMWLHPAQPPAPAVDAPAPATPAAS